MTTDPDTAARGPGDDRPVPDVGRGFGGRIARTIRESTPWWPAPPTPREQAPNVVVVLLDDMGFSDFGCFGGEMSTPTVDRLAAHGIRFTGYTTVPMCTPARAALLTGRNPHAVGSGWLASNDPGYPGYQAGEISRQVPTLAEILKANGYATMAIGKWHNTPTHKVGVAADRSSWPNHRGFDRFYGFLGAETSYFEPEHLIEGDTFVAVDDYPDDYYSTDDWTDRAIVYLKEHLASEPDRPFFLYLAENAPHVPLHAKRVDRERTAGRYDDGWDALRRRRLESQQAMGLLDSRHRIPPHTPRVPEWSTLSGSERRLCARYMELYAAVIEAFDQALGRLVGFLRSAGRLDNTLILITSDNGANAVGGPHGSPNRFHSRYGGTDDANARALELLESDRLGDRYSVPAYPTGWAEASNTPFRMFKRTPMNGGIRVPLVAHWPAGQYQPGVIRPDWVHVTDLAPTIMSLAGIANPTEFRGRPLAPMDGFDASALFSDPSGRTERTRQHYELQGNRAMVDGDWKIVSLQPPDEPIDLDNWMLFDLASDPCETEDVAVEHPDIVARMAAAFEAEATANWVYPLDNRSPRRNLTVTPRLEPLVSQPRRFYPGTGTVPLSVVTPLTADRGFELSVEFAYGERDEGVVFALGDSSGGYALYVMDGQLRFVSSRWMDRPLTADCVVNPADTIRVLMVHAARGGGQGSARLSVDGREWCEIDTTPTLGRTGWGLDVGADRGPKVSADYAGRGVFAYSGVIHFVDLVPGDQAPGSLMNRPEVLSQKE